MGAIPICCSEEKSPDGDHETMVAEVAIRTFSSTYAGLQVVISINDP